MLTSTESFGYKSTLQLMNISTLQPLGFHTFANGSFKFLKLPLAFDF